MLLWLASVTAAAAAPLDAAIGGLDAPRSVQLLVAEGGAVAWSNCSDAGQPPDDAVDGVWRCDPMTVDAAEAEVALLVDGALRSVGTAAWDSDDRPVSIQVEGGSVGLSTARDLHAPADGARAALPGRTVIVRIPTYEDAGAPVLRLQGSGGAMELNCGDDGRFPDRARNDAELACSGAAPLGDRLTATLLPARGGESVPLGEVRLGEPAISQWRLDLDVPALVAVELDAVATAFAAPADRPEDPLPPKERGEQDGGPPPGDEAHARPEPVDPNAPTTGSQSSPHGPNGGGEPPRPPSAGGSGGPDSGVLVFGLVAIALAGGAAAGRRKDAKRDRLAPLTVVPAPPLFDGGPSVTDGGAWLSSADPDGLARALVPLLAETRRVVVASTTDLDLPASRGASTYAVVQPHIDDLVDAIAALADRPGPELAVLLVGPEPLLMPGEIGPDPAQELERRLPPGAFLGVLAAPDRAPSAWLAAFRVDGPPWRGVGA